MKSGRVQWQKAEETRKINIVLIHQDKKFFISKLLNFIQDAILLILHLQDNVLIPNDFFEHICHIVCAINLHSIMHSGLIPGGQNLSNRQTVFFVHVDLMDEEHKDPDKIYLNAPRFARYLQTAWKKH